MLPRKNRLTSSQFERAFNQSQVVRHPLVQVRAHRRDDETNPVRAAFVVPKKQGKAHDRNRTKRRLRERFRLHPRRDEANLRGCDLIFLTTPATSAATMDELDAALDETLRRLGKRMNDGNTGRDAVPGEKGATRTGATRTGVKEARRDEMAGEWEIPSEVAAETPAPKREIRFREAPVSWVFLALIRFYQSAISPSLPPSCRFFPTCSAYTALAIERHGPFWGVLLGVWRLGRCTPLCKGGFDPVPERLSPRPFPFLWKFSRPKTSKG